MEKEYYVYELIDPRNNKIFYVGKGKGKRMYKHVHEVRNHRVPNTRNRALYNYIRQLLNEHILPIYKKIHETDNEKEAYLIEEKKIKEIGLKNLCNIICGGWVGKSHKGQISPMKGKHHTKEAKEKMSVAHLGRKASKQTRERMSAALKGKKPSIETKRKIGKALMGHSISEETKRKISLTKIGQIPWNKGKTNIYTKEVRDRMSLTHKGKKLSKEHIQKIVNSRKGYKHSDKAKQKISLAAKRQWQRWHLTIS